MNQIIDGSLYLLDKWSADNDERLAALRHGCSAAERGSSDAICASHTRSTGQTVGELT